MDAKSKIWMKDRFNIYDYQVGDLVTVVRKSSRGYPNKLVTGVFYKVCNIDKNVLDLIKEDDPKFRARVHYLYLMKKSLYQQYTREDKLNFILDDNSL